MEIEQKRGFGWVLLGVIISVISIILFNKFKSSIFIIGLLCAVSICYNIFLNSEKSIKEGLMITIIQFFAIIAVISIILLAVDVNTLLSLLFRIIVYSCLALPLLKFIGKIFVLLIYLLDIISFFDIF